MYWKAQHITKTLACIIFAMICAAPYMPAYSWDDWDDAEGYNTYFDVYKYQKKDAVFSETIEVAPEQAAACSDDYQTCLSLYILLDPITVSIECTGQANDGGWSLQSLKNDNGEPKCWNDYKVCYDEHGINCLNDDEISFATIPDATVHFSSISTTQDDPSNFSHCEASSTSLHKEYCIWAEDNGLDANVNDLLSYRHSGGSYDYSSDFTGNTGDDMFKIKTGASGFIEYTDMPLSESHKLKFIDRDPYDVTDPSSVLHDMMIPAGPKNTLDDYKNFIDSTLSGDIPHVSATPACYPVRTSVDCGLAVIGLNGVDGKCGDNNRKLIDKELPIAGNMFCANGTVTNVRKRNRFVIWDCAPFGVNEGSASCFSFYDIDFMEEIEQIESDNGLYADIDGDGDGDLTLDEANDLGTPYVLVNNYNAEDNYD